jgi:C-terminal processing protease CtpA/Prc
MRILLVIAILGIKLLSINNVSAQIVSLTDDDKVSILKTIKVKLKENYYFSEKVPEMIAKLDSSLASGKYKNLNSVEPFMKAVETDLYSIARDKHIRLKLKENVTNPADRSESKPNLHLLNEGLTELQILEGNIGYIKTTGFGDLESDRNIVASAFNFLKNTDALIIDLTENHGGTYSRLLASYLLNEDSIHLITYFWKNQEADSIYTFKKLEGKRYLNKPVFLLTSALTFSSAEEFVYDLKNLNRVTVIGETTRGGANPGRPVQIYKFKDNSTLTIFIPFGRVVSPITQSNWEGSGIEPDIKVAKEQAIKCAYKQAIALKIKKSDDKQEIKSLEKILNEIKLD